MVTTSTCPTQNLVAVSAFFSTPLIQEGQDPWDALSCMSFLAKEPLIIGLFCGKWPTKIRHPMTLRHPVRTSCVYWRSDTHYVYPTTPAFLQTLSLQNNVYCNKTVQWDRVCTEWPPVTAGLLSERVLQCVVVCCRVLHSVTTGKGR